MTNTQAVELLVACKTLADRASTEYPSGLPINFRLTSDDLENLSGLTKVQNDLIVKGPGLLKHLFTSAGLNQVEVYKLDQIDRMVFKRRRLGQDAHTGGIRPAILN